jgi:hypothetical protein
MLYSFTLYVNEKSKISKKLSLKKDALANLNDSEKMQIKGGRPYTDDSVLVCYTDYCRTYYKCK